MDGDEVLGVYLAADSFQGGSGWITSSAAEKIVRVGDWGAALAGRPAALGDVEAALADLSAGKLGSALEFVRTLQRAWRAQEEIEHVDGAIDYGVALLLTNGTQLWEVGSRAGRGPCLVPSPSMASMGSAAEFGHGAAEAMRQFGQSTQAALAAGIAVAARLSTDAALPARLEFFRARP